MPEHMQQQQEADHVLLEAYSAVLQEWTVALRNILWRCGCGGGGSGGCGGVGGCDGGDASVLCDAVWMLWAVYVRRRGEVGRGTKAQQGRRRRGSQEKRGNAR